MYKLAFFNTSLITTKSAVICGTWSRTTKRKGADRKRAVGRRGRWGGGERSWG